MSSETVEFDASVASAVDCAFIQLEDADAVESWLQARREEAAGDEKSRWDEGLAYFRYQEGADA